MELCLDVIATHLHTFQSFGHMIPHHLMKEILDRRKNETMTDHDLPLFLETTFEAVPPEELTFLSLKSCRSVSDEGFKLVFASCQSLTALDLSFCELLTDNALQAMAKSCCALESLDLTACRFITDAGCGSISRLRSLTELDLSLCNKVTDLGIQAIVRSAGPRLRSLNLGDIRQMSNISVQLVADHCSSLRSLSIAGSMKVMDLDVGDVCKHALLLQSLNLRACRRLTDGCLKYIGNLLRLQHRKGHPPLTSLDLGGCSRLTDDGVATILPSCSSLTHLDLRGCKQLTPRIEELLAKYCPAMADLTLPKFEDTAPATT